MFTSHSSPSVRELTNKTVKLWNAATGECLRVIDDRVCARLDITDVIGLSAGQRTALKLMGAVDESKDCCEESGL